MSDASGLVEGIEAHPNNKVVFFDIDETLFNYRHASGAGIEAAHAHFIDHGPLDFVKSAWRKAVNTAQDRVIRDESQPLEAQRAILTKYGEERGLGYNYPVTGYVIDFCDIYRTNFRDNRRASEGAIELLTKLKDKGWRIVIVTNGDKEQEQEKARAIDVFRFADRFVAADDGEGTKPDPRIFEFAAEEFGIEPEEAFVVGQSLENDIKGAVRAGAAAILYRPGATEKIIEVEGFEVPVVSTLLQLVDVLGVL